MKYEPVFLISSPDAVITKVSILFKNKCLLTVYFGDNEDSFTTTILEINKKDKTFIFHHGCNENLTEQLLNSSDISFKTKCLGVDVAFESRALKKIKYEGATAFAVPIPTSMLWMERREFYRVKASAENPSYCQLTLKNSRSINAKLYDISIVGFSMLTDSKDVSEVMVIGASFDQCKLILGDTGKDAISFEIRNKYLVNSQDPKSMEKIVCKFTQITSAFEDSVQRYMQRIEREARQKELDNAWPQRPALASRKT